VSPSTRTTSCRCARREVVSHPLRLPVWRPSDSSVRRYSPSGTARRMNTWMPWPSALRQNAGRCAVPLNASSPLPSMRGSSGPSGAILGIDFGGTKVALRVDAEGTALASDRLLIETGESALEVVGRTVSAACRLLDNCEVPAVAVGIATPGIVHDDRIELA